MKARIWGCRGSLAAPGPETVRYGGNTSCVEVRLDDGTALVLDAGTGIRSLGLVLERQQVRVVHLLLSHLHMDHLQGLGFFTPLYDPDTEIHVWGPPSTVQSLEDRIGAYLSPPLFPVSLAEIPSRLTFHDAPDEPWSIGSATVLAVTVAHQGPTLGYRIEENGRSLAYIPDHEPSLGVDLRSMGEDWLSGQAVARHADVLIHDAQYSEEEYPDHVGWGHSSIEHVVTFAQMVGVKRLLLFHHDPHHSDAELDELCARARQLWPGSDDFLHLGAEGMEIDFSSAQPFLTRH